MVFLVLSHRDPELVERLLGRLGDTETAITVVHHDPRFSRAPALPTGGRAVAMPDPGEGGWGAMEIVAATLRCLRWIRDEIPDFSWVVIVSGQDYPIRASRRIEAELLASDADAMLRWEFVPPIASPRNSDWQRGTSHRYFWHMFPGTHRPIPIPRVSAFFDGVPVHAGSQWMNLGHRAVDCMLGDEVLLAHLNRRFRSVLLPDEAFFQTLLLNAPTGLDLICNDRRFYRFPKTGGSAHPDVLTIDDLDTVRASDAFFARKFELTTSAELMDELDRLAAQPSSVLHA